MKKYLCSWVGRLSRVKASILAKPVTVWCNSHKKLIKVSADTEKPIVKFTWKGQHSRNNLDKEEWSRRHHS